MDPALALEIEMLSQQRAVNQLIERGDSDIQQFYKDAVIFMSGGSGFIGKQLIEKLFRSCKIKKIYLLLRPKKQKTIEQRLAEFTEEPVFDILRKTQPDFSDKMEAIAGDIYELRLGMSDSNWNTVTEEANIIFHVAATVSFVEPIKIATLTNVRGTREMLALGNACKQLRSYVHVSTAYAHATFSRIGKPVLEQFYPSPVPPTTMIEFAESVDQTVLDDMTPQMIKPWPNTYTFTKAIAEEAVRTMAGDLPICIVRPAIVICSRHEPSPGWIDKSNVLGPSGLILGIGLGVVHVLNADPEASVAYVPVDYVNNVIMAAAHETVIRRKRGDTDIKIYNVVTSKNTVTIDNVAQIMQKFTYRYTTDKSLWYAFALIVKNDALFRILFWFYHFIPAYLIDGILWILGKRTLALKQYEKAYKLGYVLGYFISNSWKFEDKNLMELRDNMSPTDSAIYQFDMSTIDWKQYITVWCIGIRKYILKDGLNNTAYGVKKQKYLRVANFIFFVLYIYILWKFVCVMYWALSCMSSTFTSFLCEHI